MGICRGTGHHDPVGGLPEKEHLNDLLDDALAGTFPASDPTSSFVCERERPPSVEGGPQDAASRRTGKEKSR